MRTESIRLWLWAIALLGIRAFASAEAIAGAASDAEPASPFQSLFTEDPNLKPVRWVAAEAYYQVGRALTANPEQGYRWEYWALQPDGKPLGRMAPSGNIASRRLIDLGTGETIGAIDCTTGPLTVAIVNRYGRRINLDLCMAMPGDRPVRTPFPLFRVERRGRQDQPVDVDPQPLGWIDEFQGLLLDDKERPVARFEPIRLSDIGARTNRHDVFYAAQSLTTALLTGPPSKELQRRIEERAGKLTNSASLPTKLLRVELAARWVQVEAAMVTDTSASIVWPPERIAEVRRALGIVPINELNYVWKEQTRRLLWDSLAAASPFYQFYAEGAVVAGLSDDPEVLEHALRLLKAAWIKAGHGQIKVKCPGPFEDWMRVGLGETLALQAIRTPDEALKLSAAYKVLPPSMLARPREPGAPPVVSALPSTVLRAANIAGTMDRAMHLAAALQRSSRDVTLWSLSVEKSIDESTKTRVQEPLILFPKEAGKPELLAIGGDYFLGPLKGRKIAAGYYEFASIAVLQPLLVRSARFQVAMVGVLDGQIAPSAWATGVQKALGAIRHDDPNLASILLEGSVAQADSWERFNAKAAESLATLAQNRFALFVRENNIEVRIEKVRDGKVAETTLVKDIDARARDDILPRHEAAIGRCFQMLPTKIEDGIRFITLRSRPILEPLPSAVIEDGKIKIDTRDRPVIGRAGPTGLMLAAPRFPEAYHELMHRWANAQLAQYEVGRWKGTLVEPFAEISWQRKGKGPGWERRSDAFRSEDFWWDYGATNEREDFAVIGQFYGAFPMLTRARVRAELKKGNFTPAAKYLYFKAIAFLDNDRRSLEIDVDEADKPFSFAEFEKTARDIDRRIGLSHEQKRLLDLVQRMKALNEKLRATKESRDPVPLSRTR